VTLAELPARTTTRVVAQPVATSWVRRGGASGPIAQLGGEHGGVIFLRFAVPNVAPDRLAAAYLVLTPVDVESPIAEGTGSDVPGVVLHALRVVDPWNEDVTWANQPRTFDVGLPALRVDAARARTRVRIDVRALVARWARHDPADQGIAIEGQGAPPLAVALAPVDPELARAPAAPAGFARVAGPELELYFLPTTREDSGSSPVQR
jgi:hypothetical protein